VAQTDNSFLEHNAPSLASRFVWIALMLAALYLSYFHNLGALGLVGPDEPRYAWIARDMMETGDWVTPRLYGKPWFEKPVLYYWGAALSFKLFGVNEAAARLPSAASALLATLALAWLARRFYGAATARWLMLFLPTTVGMIGFSHAAATDMPFSAMLTMAMVSAAFVLGLVRDEHTPILPRTPWLALVFLGFFLGLAVLAKGPAAIVLSGGALLLWAISTKRWRDTVRCLHPVALTSFCLTALPWYILCARRNPEFFRVFIIEHNFKRYVTPEFQHIQPFWFYLPITLLAMFPWTILLIPASQRALAVLRGRHPESGSTLFLLCWVAFPVVFFSASRSKLPGYILPAIPPLALLLAASLPARLRPAEKPAGWLVGGLAAGLPVLAIALSAFSRKWPASSDILPSSDVRLLGFTVAFAGLTVVVLALLRRDRAALFALVLLVLLLVLKTGDLLGKFDPALTARSALSEARRNWPEFSPSDAATWGLARSEGYQLNFYARSVLPEWQPGEPAPNWLFLKPTARTEAEGSSFACLADRAYRAVIPCRYSGSARGLGVFRGGRDHRVRDGQPR
jgi:4-amino-4-deoxy-L-arabinose transferase-like glycosyltransferase